MTPIPPSFLMAGFFYLCYTGSVHKIGEEGKLLKDYDWWVKAWNAYNNPPTKTIPLDASDALQGKITSVVVLVIAIFAIPLIIRRAIADAKEDMMGKIELVAAVIASVCLSVMCVWMVYDAFAMEQTQEVKTSVTHPLGFEDQLEKDFKVSNLSCKTDAYLILPDHGSYDCTFTSKDGKSVTKGTLVITESEKVGLYDANGKLVETR